MTRLLIATVISVVLAAIAEQRDRMLSPWGYEYKERLVTGITMIFLSFFCGLRIWGNDTVTYMQIYQQTPVLNEYTLDSFASGIGFGLTVSTLKTLGLSTQDFLLFFAFLTVIPYVLFVRRFSTSFSFGIYLMFATGMYTFSMAAVKQCMATGICLMALSLALDRRWGRYCLAILLATLFHPYSLIYLAVPFMMFKPWTPRTLVCVLMALVLGFYLDSLIGTVLDITAMMGAEYTADTFVGEGVNVFRVAVAFVPLMLAFIYGKPLFRNTTREEDLMFNLAMLNALIMFIGLFGTANYFARLANYFLPAQVIALPWLLKKTAPMDQAWLKPACIVGYLGYFYYEYGILHSFDVEYAQISLFDYLEDLLGRLL